MADDPLHKLALGGMLQRVADSLIATHRRRVWLQRVSLDFFAELCAVLPFPIRRLQCDAGTEFPLAFALAVQAAGIAHRYIRPRCPEQHGKVERSHRIDNEELWDRQDFDAFDSAERGLRGWECIYTFDRFSTVLHGSTPVEKLQRLLPDVQVA